MGDPDRQTGSGLDREDVPGGAAPRYVPPLRRRPPQVGEPTARQARAVALAGLTLTLALGVIGAVGVVWTLLAILGFGH